jgi:hypothetical protein
MARTRRVGKQVFHAIASPEALALRRTLYALYCPTQEGESA